MEPRIIDFKNNNGEIAWRNKEMKSAAEFWQVWNSFVTSAAGESPSTVDGFSVFPRDRYYSNLKKKNLL